MQFSAKSNYATLAMIELAIQHGLNMPVAIRAIGQAHQIPIPFLTQILQQLRSAGLVASRRGPSGGYQLRHAPDQISIADIFDAMGESYALETPEGEDRFDNQSGSMIQLTANQLWQDIESLVREKLETTTLQDLVEQSQRQSADMFYI